MKPLAERYETYSRERKAEIDKELKAAGLSPMGVNSLYALKEGKRIATLEEFATASDEVMSGLAEVGIKHRREQSARARKPRGKVGEDGEPLSQIIGRLALSGDQEESAKELWSNFYGELDGLLLKPVETQHPSDLKKLAYEYGAEGGRKRITFGRFQNRVSAYRKKSR